MVYFIPYRFPAQTLLDHTAGARDGRDADQRFSAMRQLPRFPGEMSGYVFVPGNHPPSEEGGMWADIQLPFRRDVLQIWGAPCPVGPFHLCVGSEITRAAKRLNFFHETIVGHHFSPERENKGQVCCRIRPLPWTEAGEPILLHLSPAAMNMLSATSLFFAGEE